MKNSKLIFVALLILVGLFVLSQRSRKPVNPLTREPSNKESLTLALDWTPNTNHTGFYVAQSKGWYKDEGIELKILPSSSVAADVLVAEGKADLGISSTEGVVADAALGSSVISIAAIIGHNTSALVARADAEIEKPSDLDGKTYGGFGAPYENAVVKKVIQNDDGQGIFKSVVLEVNTLEALKSKKIDFAWIFYAWDGIAAQEQDLELKTFFINENGIPDYATPNIITSPRTIQTKKDLVKKFMKATSKGYEFARNNPQESATILINSVEKGLFPDEKLVYESQEWLSPRYAERGKKWGVQDEEIWNEYTTFMLENEAVLDQTGKPLKSLEANKLFTNEFIN